MKTDRFGGYTGMKFKATGFFRIEETEERYWLIDPDGHPFFIVGMAHLDDATWKYDELRSQYLIKYKNRETWIKEKVVKSLKNWGFNSLAWTMENVTSDFRHSPEWTPEEYKKSGMPFVVHIQMTPNQLWNRQRVYVDPFSDEYREWCEYQARYWAGSLKDCENLIGYAYVARPSWISPDNPLLKDIDLRTEEGIDRLKTIITKHYEVAYNAIKKYDQNHLIIGDKIGAPPRAEEPMEVTINCIGEYTDVLAINWYNPFEVVRPMVEHWQKMINKPIIFTDSAFIAPTEISPNMAGVKVRTEEERGYAFADYLSRAGRTKYTLGWGWCSFGTNLQRCYGLIDREDRESVATVIMKEYMEEFYKNIGWEQETE